MFHRRRHISNKNLYKKVFKLKMNIANNNNLLMAKFNAVHVLHHFESYIIQQVLTKEQKRAMIEFLNYEVSDAESIFEMQLDDSIWPNNYWSSNEGTIASSTSSNDYEIEISNNEAEVNANNEAEQSPANNHGDDKDNEDVSSSLDNKKFIDCIVATITCILDPFNIVNATAAKWMKWPKFREKVIIRVLAAAGVPIHTIKAWILDAPMDQPRSSQELEAQQQ